MGLSFSPLPEFSMCGHKVFAPGELHITRIFSYSVLILLYEGVLRFRENGETVELHPGEYYIQREGLLQEGVPLDEPPVYDYVHFNGTFREEKGLPLRGTFLSDVSIPLTERLMTFERGNPSDPFRVQSNFFRLLSLLFSENATYSETRLTAERIYRELETDYASPHPLSELSQKFGYTEDHLIRLFRERYGMTPHKALAEIRLEQARWLMENTSIGVEKIAFSVGYNDFSTFYRAFRKKHGVAPGAQLRRDFLRRHQHQDD